MNNAYVQHTLADFFILVFVIHYCSWYFLQKCLIPVSNLFSQVPQQLELELASRSDERRVVGQRHGEPDVSCGYVSCGVRTCVNRGTGGARVWGRSRAHGQGSWSHFAELGMINVLLVLLLEKEHCFSFEVCGLCVNTFQVSWVALVFLVLQRWGCKLMTLEK